jgi:hypothetical protein
MKRTILVDQLEKKGGGEQLSNPNLVVRSMNRARIFSSKEEFIVVPCFARLSCWLRLREPMILQGCNSPALICFLDNEKQT